MIFTPKKYIITEKKSGKAVSYIPRGIDNEGKLHVNLSTELDIETEKVVIFSDSISEDGLYKITEA